ncbi:MAG: hypothetical protein RL077_958 [Verrucomicrobiota bacterium]|jgi:hypothetical protein
MRELNDRDREAVLLPFFARRAFAKMGATRHQRYGARGGQVRDLALVYALINPSSPPANPVS